MQRHGDMKGELEVVYFFLCLCLPITYHSSPSIPANIAIAVGAERLLEQIEHFGVCAGVP